jgi:hypothetical protein
MCQAEELTLGCQSHPALVEALKEVALADDDHALNS